MTGSFRPHVLREYSLIADGERSAVIGPDGPLHKSEGAFLLCGFWLAQATHTCGDSTAAARWFERNRAACGPAGLYTEE